jgi:SNF2 family DNA or RNA helicase
VRYLGKYTPFDHQVKTTEFLVSKKRAFVLNDIGTGKTLSAIWALDNIMTDQPDLRCLIISPKSTLNLVWGRELFVTLPDLSSKVLVGAKAKRSAMLDDDPRIAVINPHHAALDVIINHPWSDKLDLIIVDEFTAFKTHTTAVYKCLRALVHPDCTLWMMSGSPMPQAPTDIWAPAKLICPDQVHRTFTRFKEWAMVKITPFLWRPRPKVEAKIAELIKDYSIRFTRDDCLDLPPTMYDTRRVDASKAQVEIERRLKKDAAVAIQDGDITAVNEGVHMLKLLQAATGAVKYVNDDGDDKAHWVNCQSKLEALAEVVNESTQPVIVFSPFRAPLVLLESWAKKHGHKCAVIHGGVNQKNRDAAFDALNDGTIKLLLAQPNCMSHGLTLTNSNTIVWWGLPYSFETYEQANGRIIRSGQTRSQYIIHLINSKVEELVLSKLSQRGTMQGILLELLAQD